MKVFSTLALPPTRLTQEDVSFHVSPAILAVLESLKSAFTNAPVLAHFDPDL
jgi:hypothetical protein